jgi:hypothetical protein
MTLLDDRIEMSTPDFKVQPPTLKSAPPNVPPRTYNCVCTPSRATFWRYPVPGTDGKTTVGEALTLATLIGFNVAGYWLLAFGG